MAESFKINQITYEKCVICNRVHYCEDVKFYQEDL